jgi:hypothetical protein
MRAHQRTLDAIDDQAVVDAETLVLGRLVAEREQAARDGRVTAWHDELEAEVLAALTDAGLPADGARTALDKDLAAYGTEPRIETWAYLVRVARQSGQLETLLAGHTP